MKLGKLKAQIRATKKVAVDFMGTPVLVQKTDLLAKLDTLFPDATKATEVEMEMVVVGDFSLLREPVDATTYEDENQMTINDFLEADDDGVDLV